MNDVFAGWLAILGLGYTGLPTAVALTTRRVEVIGVDANPEIVASVSRGEVPFVEPDLAVAVSGAVAMGRLKATTETPEADAYIIAVPTPFNGDHTADLRYPFGEPCAFGCPKTYAAANTLRDSVLHNSSMERGGSFHHPMMMEVIEHAATIHLENPIALPRSRVPSRLSANESEPESGYTFTS